jgi:hypothetical protein
LSEDRSGGGKAHAVEQEEEEVVGAIDDFVTIVVFPDNDKHLLELVSDLDVDLSNNVDQYSTKVFRKRIMDLFKVRRKMKKNMTPESGTHDRDPWKFLENAMLGSYIWVEQDLGVSLLSTM